MTVKINYDLRLDDAMEYWMNMFNLVISERYIHENPRELRKSMYNFLKRILTTIQAPYNPNENYLQLDGNSQSDYMISFYFEENALVGTNQEHKKIVHRFNPKLVKMLREEYKRLQK